MWPMTLRCCRLVRCYAHGDYYGVERALLGGAIGAGRLLRPAGWLLGDFLGRLVGEDGVLVGILGVLVGVGGVLVGFFVVAGFVVLGCGVVGFGGFFVMMGGGAVGFVCHGYLL